MKKAIKIISIILAVCIVASGVVFGFLKSEEINFFFSKMHAVQVSISDGTWKEELEKPATPAADTGFVPGTYAGIEFNTVDDVANYYVEAYNKTKAETAKYIDADGNEQEYYAFVGDEELIPTSILIEGKENVVITKLGPTIVSNIFKSNVCGLPPSSNRDPQYDVDEFNEPLLTSRIKGEDIKKCSVTDNGDGTITLTLIPQDCNMSHKGLDAQGNMFNALGPIDETVEAIELLSWAEGDTAQNCRVVYADGTAVIKIDTATQKIVEADYDMKVTASVTHASISVVKDKSATLVLDYIQHFPASDEYLMESRGLARK
ncbi:MAG: hypothetical protein K2G22_04855 [Eubacterium sp.]|nr:hypothetical protein [Eubacterium sp.]